MLSEDFSLHFEGFTPSEKEHQNIRIALNDIYLKAPHRSLLKASFKSDGSFIEGAIDITSTAGNFNVVTNGKDIESASQEAIEKIKWQLDSWKAKRF